MTDSFSPSDPTGGNVNYLDKDSAMSKGLAYVENGTTVLKVDDFTQLKSGDNRDSCAFFFPALPTPPNIN